MPGTRRETVFQNGVGPGKQAGGQNPVGKSQTGKGLSALDIAKAAAGAVISGARNDLSKGTGPKKPTNAGVKPTRATGKKPVREDSGTWGNWTSNATGQNLGNANRPINNQPPKAPLGTSYTGGWPEADTPLPPTGGGMPPPMPTDTGEDWPRWDQQGNPLPQPDLAKYPDNHGYPPEIDTGLGSQIPGLGGAWGGGPDVIGPPDPNSPEMQWARQYYQQFGSWPPGYEYLDQQRILMDGWG